MKELTCKHSGWLSWPAILSIGLVIVAFTFSVRAQAAPSDAETMQQRLTRARALTAAHNLTAAAFELDVILKSSNDEVLRDVARIMLMGIHLEQADYGRAQFLLDETYKARTQQSEGSARSYFAVAGRTAYGLREHLERFRAVGLHTGNKDLPPEALADLDKVRSLLEHVIQQAKEIGAEDEKNTDAFALLEDLATLRLRLSRDMEERDRWQSEIADARQHLSASDTRLASLNGPMPNITQSPILAPVKNTEAQASASVNTAIPEKTSETVGGAAPTGSATAGILNIGSLNEHATQRVSPTYPTFAKAAHITGVVRVDLVINEKGYVISAQSANGPAVLRQAAVDASKRWKFRPIIRDGRPVQATGFLNFNFTTQ